jgi:glycosyltransferase involved in cell wall biosynthesis
VTSGIDGSPGENIVIAERPDDFAGKVIELLNDRGLREKIGGAARRLMVDNHSWEKLADRLNDLLVRAAASKPPARAKRDRPWR